MTTEKEKVLPIRLKLHPSKVVAKGKLTGVSIWETRVEIIYTNADGQSFSAFADDFVLSTPSGDYLPGNHTTLEAADVPLSELEAKEAKRKRDLRAGRSPR